MEATLSGDTVRVDAPARERFYDSRGYGRPAGDGLDLAPVEAAHLLFRGDLASVDGLDFRAFLAETDCFVPFLVYKDLRDRGFYLAPGRDDWPGPAPAGADIVVYPRGSGPWDGDVAYRVTIRSERETVTELDGTLAVVDEESEITYLDVSRPELSGRTDGELPGGVPGALLGDRVVLWDPPAELYEQAFYGQPLDGREAEGPLQCSLVEAAYLADRGTITVTGGVDALLERGREVEGERFERRLAAYRELRDAGVVPKTGYKFGADFRAYTAVEDVENLGHSDYLVRVVPADQQFDPRGLALDVRLAHGVRKTMVFALVGGDGAGGTGAGGTGAGGTGAGGTGGLEWRAVERLTP